MNATHAFARDERGVGLVFALLASAVVAAITWTMFTSGLLDLAVSDNYRSHRAAFYAADAGIERTLIDFKVDTDWVADLLDIQQAVITPPGSATIEINGIDVELDIAEDGFIVPKYYPMGTSSTIGDANYTREVWLPPLVAVGDCEIVEESDSGSAGSGSGSGGSGSGSGGSGSGSGGSSSGSGGSSSGSGGSSSGSGGSSSGSGASSSGDSASSASSASGSGDSSSGSSDPVDPCDLLEELNDSSSSGSGSGSGSGSSSGGSGSGSGGSGSGSGGSASGGSGGSGSGDSGSGGSGDSGSDSGDSGSDDSYASMFGAFSSRLLGLVTGFGAGGPKVTICHVPPGNPDNAHTITIGASAVPSHLDNHEGDYEGACDDDASSDSSSSGSDSGSGGSDDDDAVDPEDPVFVFLKVRSTGTADNGSTTRILADLVFTLSTESDILDIRVSNWREER